MGIGTLSPDCIKDRCVGVEIDCDGLWDCTGARAGGWGVWNDVDAVAAAAAGACSGCRGVRIAPEVRCG